jgi:hypothetical protein
MANNDYLGKTSVYSKKTSNTFGRYTFQYLTSGKFTPATTGITAVTSAAGSFHWQQIADKVTGSGSFDVTPSGSASTFVLDITTLPVAPPNLGINDAYGVVSGLDEAGLACNGYIQGNGSKLRLTIKYASATTLHSLIRFTFSYTLTPGN